MFITSANSPNYPDHIDLLRRDVSYWHRADHPKRSLGNAADDWT
jgi:hypothetical protein